jgi:CheY-like chemotaxis protein/HPt (histidine-containing phosphotransfer) domain-containing protein/anti-sigma regulatory factor (Ser/Thr protein kinase)
VDDALQTLALRAHGKGLELACDYPPDVPAAVVGDPVRVRQVLVNLVGNAIKFTASGGVTVSVRAAGGHVRFAVTDTGIGIPPDRLQAVFEPFTQADGSTTRKYGGTGLGLTISARLVELMGGRIWAESEVGRGSTFHFTAQLAAVADDPPALPAAAAGLAVLVADDHPVARRAAADTLTAFGLRPTAVPDGAAALAELERAAAAGTPYPLALLDGGMPGADGFAVAAAARERRLTAGPVLVLLASGDPAADADRCRRAGAGYLLKPVRRADLVRAVRSAVEPDASVSSRTPPPRAIGTGRSAAIRPLRVLLVDDNPFNQKVAVMKLERAGHAVRVAGCGNDALAALADGTFDLMLTDVQMPDMDGFELTAAVRAAEAGTGRRLPVVAMTAHAMSGYRERCLAAGMDGYVAKPVRDDDLWRAIREAVPAGEPDAGPAASQDTLPTGRTPPAIDAAALHRRVGGDAEAVRQLVEVFRQDCAALLPEVEAGVSAGDPARVRAAAHTLKGMLAFFDARPATAAARALEDMAARGDLDGAAGPMADLKAAVADLDRALAPVLAGG